MDAQQFAPCNSPSIASRIPIFSPTRRPSVVEQWEAVTPWGNAIITGRLGQQHRDLLDAARQVAIEEQWTQDGRLHLKLDPARLRSALGGDSVNPRLVAEWIEDLRVAKVELRIGNRVIVGGLIGEYELSSDPTILHSRPGAHGAERHYMRLSFSTAWSKLIEEDRMQCYPLAKVIQMKHGISQAIARFCLSHREINDSIEGLMAKVGDSGRLRNRRRELAHDCELLAELGIKIEGDRVTRRAQTKPSKKGGGAGKVR